MLQAATISRSHQGSQTAEDLRRYLVDDAKCTNNVPLVQALNAFVVRLKAVTTSSPTTEIVDIITFAFWLSAHDSVTLEPLSVSTRESYGRVKKVGAYYLACVFIHSTLKDLDRKSPSLRQSSSLRQSFALLQLQPPPTTTITPFADTMVAINSWLRQQSGLPEIDDWAKVVKCYSHAQRGIPGSTATLNVTASQHCELTVALHLRQRKVERGFPGPFIEVGYNKASCFYCATYIRTFNDWCTETRQDHRIVVRREHYKHVDGWVMPSSGPQEVTRRVLSTIGSTMQEIVDAVAAPSRWLFDYGTPPSLDDLVALAMHDNEVEGGWRFG